MIADAYAQALFDLAKAEGLERAIGENLEALDRSFDAEPAFLRLLASPELSKQTRLQMIDDSFQGKMQPFLLNFLKLLTQKGHILQFRRCQAAYQALLAREQGILPVLAVTAVPLASQQTQKLENKLTKLTGKTVRLRNQIDPAVYGGIRLHYGSEETDGTVLCRLAALQHLLKKAGATWN